jgi:hypothetical protein
MLTGRTEVLSIVLGAGWLCIAAGTFAYQLWKAPSLLYRPKGINLLPLYKFAFQRVTVEIAHNLELEFQRTSKLSSINRAYVSQSIISEGGRLQFPSNCEAT